MVAPAMTDVRTQVDEMVADTTRATGRQPEYWPPAELERFQASAALLSAAHALRSPFYQEKFAGLAAPADAGQC